MMDDGASAIRQLKAADVMSKKLVTVTPEMSARSVAIALFENAISAVPVVGDSGLLLGIISEGDLMPRDETARDARRDWWLGMLSDGGEVNPDYVKFLKQDRSAREIMISPVVTVDENADLVAVAELLSEKRIKRVPVLRDGHLVGIVSRADLVRAFARPGRAREPEPQLGRHGFPVASEALPALTRRQPTAPTSQPRSVTDLSADAFQDLVARFEAEEAERREQAKRLLEEKHRQQAGQMLSVQLTEEAWERMLGSARTAARSGGDEFLLIRFPCELCSDHGRAVNAPDPEWPSTLRGIAGEIFMRWKTELRPHGFGLNARVVEFPNGIPGDIGLYLSWGKKR